MNATAIQNAGRRKSRRRRSHSGKARLLLASLAFLMLFAGMIFRYTEIAGLGRRVTERENRIEQLSAKRDALRQQIGTHTKKAYIEEIAKSELAMEYRDDVYTASIDSEPVANHSLTGKNPTLFGQLSVFVFGLLYR